MKTCLQCRKEFHPKPRGTHQIKFCSVRCRRQHHNQTNAAKVVARNRHLRNHYRLTPEQYRQMVATQNGVCAICGGDQTHPTRTSLDIDHDHRTGIIRGLVCSRCNHLLGAACDNTEILYRAIYYLADAKIREAV